MHGYPVAAGAILLLLAARNWHYEKAPRTTAWFFGIGAFLTTIGVTLWLDALAGLTAAGTGLTVLTAVLLVGALSWYHEGIRKHKHHRVWTPVLAIVFGTALVLGIANWARLLHKAAKTGGKSSEALGQVIYQVHSGKAATALPPGEMHTIAIMGACALAVLVILAIRHERNKKGGASKSGPPAITSGRGASRTSGRPAITSGRRR